MSLQITPRIKYNFDYRWTEWSAYSDIHMEFGNDIPLLMWGSVADLVGTGGANHVSANNIDYTLGLQDVGYWGMGVEYQYNDLLALRIGYEDRPSAVPDATPNVFVPMSDAKLYSAGFGLELTEDRHIDFAIGYLISKNHIPPCAAQLGNGCEPLNPVYYTYAGQDIRTKVEALIIELSFQQPF